MSNYQNDYHWTVSSAIWQITFGGPTHRTLSAIEHLNYTLSDHENVFGLASQVPAWQLLDMLIRTRGLQNLREALAPLPDETETTTGFDNTE